MALFPSRLKQFITNSKTITKVDKYALDATQNNPEIEGTLAYEIKRIEAEFAEKLNNAMKWKFIGMFDLENNIEKSINIPEIAQEIWVAVGEKSNAGQIYGGNSAVIPKADNSSNNKHLLFFNEIHGATGVTLATGARVFYDGNNLRITVKDIGTNFRISTRVYYR